MARPAAPSPRAAQVAPGAWTVRPRLAPRRREAPRGLRRYQTARVRPDPERLEAAVVAMRSHALALALWVFVLGFSIDDLRVLRFPPYILGLAGSFLLVAFGPYWLGRRFVLRHRRRGHVPVGLDDWRGRRHLASSFHARLFTARRWGAFLLILSCLAFAAWLAVFAAGVPPWAV